MGTPTAKAMSLSRERDARPYSWSSGDVEGFNYWLEAEGEVVGYARVLHRRDTGHGLELSDIEISPNHRHRGFSGELLRLIQELEGQVLYSTGEYTPEGKSALYGRLPFIEGATPGSVHRPQAFVRCWKRRLLLHP